MTLLQHPLSAAFPAMPDDEFQMLIDSIGEIGVQNPITLFEGMVLDGWHRYTAAQAAEMTCPTAELGDVDPRDFVLAQNKARRNLTASQRAAAVTSVYAWHPSARPTKEAVNCLKNKQTPGVHLSKTNAELAAIAGVATTTIKQAKAAHKAGLTDAVKAGAITVKEAAKIATGKPEKPAPKLAHVEPEDNDYAGPSAAELQAVQEAAKADLDVVMELMESDDPKAALLKENERMRMELSSVKSQRDGYMNQCNELIRRVKSLKKMLEKAQGK